MKFKNGPLRRFTKWLADLITPYTVNVGPWERKNRLLRLAGLNISNEEVLIDSHFFCQSGVEENIYIDSYCAIGSKATFLSFGRIYVGKYCMFAAGVTLLNGSHDPSTFDPYSGDLKIGNGCWIGANATIAGPLTIGDNCIIGSGALVNTSIPAGSIVAGIPAQIIGRRNIPTKVWHFNNTYFDPITFEKVE